MAGKAILSVASMIGLGLAAHGFITSYPTTTPTWIIGAMVGLFVWTFFVATSSLQIAFFEKRSLTAAAINLGYRLIGPVGAGIIVSFWS